MKNKKPKKSGCCWHILSLFFNIAETFTKLKQHPSNTITLLMETDMRIKSAVFIRRESMLNWTLSL